MWNITVHGYQAGQDVAHTRPEEMIEDAVKAAVLNSDPGRMVNGAGGRMRVVSDPEYSKAILGGKGGYIVHVAFFGHIGEPEKVNPPAREVWVSVREETKPGPPKLYPHRLQLRYSDAEQTAISQLTASGGEDTQNLIRRLIREAAGKASQ